MKPFDRTRFFKFVAPLIYGLLPPHPARRFLCLLIVSTLLVQSLNIICSFWNGFLDEPADESVGYYVLIAVETTRYVGWLWGFWYSFYQLARLSPSNRLLTPQLLSCSVTGGVLLFLLIMIVDLVETEYIMLIRGMLILAFGVGVLLPTLWHPKEAN